MLVVIRPPFLASICIGEDISFRGYKYITRGSIAIESNLPLHLEKRPPPTQQKFELNSGFYKKGKTPHAATKYINHQIIVASSGIKLPFYFRFFFESLIFVKEKKELSFFHINAIFF